jgi:23S rRNA (cytosine1962-C5)-methyltransferase
MRALKRHVLKRPVCDGLESGHPWVFRDKVGDDSSLADGDWLQLVDPGGAVIGTGIYQAEGGVAIRVFRLGHRSVTVGWLKQQLETAIDRRSALSKDTDAFRILNGESDGFPGIVLDVYAGVGVLQTYAPGVDALGRYLAGLVADKLRLESLIWKAPSKRVGGAAQSNRLLRGSRPYVVKFHEGDLPLAADLFSGQKSGTYLDLRGLRRYLLGQNLRGKKVLNLFAYTGMAGLACALAGAREVVNVDQAQPSLDFGRRYHKNPAMKWVAADVFTWINDLAAQDYDLIIVDPPSMASNKTQVIKALKAYHRLYTTLLSKLKPGGTIVACCCTSRVSPREFEDKVSFALRPLSRKFAMPMEVDHKPAFSEADYLKILVFCQEVVPEGSGKSKSGGGASSAKGAARQNSTSRSAGAGDNRSRVGARYGDAEIGSGPSKPSFRSGGASDQSKPTGKPRSSDVSAPVQFKGRSQPSSPGASAKSKPSGQPKSFAPGASAKSKPRSFAPSSTSADTTPAEKSTPFGRPKPSSKPKSAAKPKSSGKPKSSAGPSGAAGKAKARSPRSFKDGGPSRGKPGRR